MEATEHNTLRLSITCFDRRRSIRCTNAARASRGPARRRRVHCACVQFTPTHIACTALSAGGVVVVDLGFGRHQRVVRSPQSSPERLLARPCISSALPTYSDPHWRCMLLTYPPPHHGIRLLAFGRASCC